MFLIPKISSWFLNLYYSVFHITDIFPELLKSIYLVFKILCSHSSTSGGVCFSIMFPLLRNLCSSGMWLLWPVSSCSPGEVILPVWETCTETGLKTREFWWGWGGERDETHRGVPQAPNNHYWLLLFAASVVGNFCDQCFSFKPLGRRALGYWHF